MMMDVLFNVVIVVQSFSLAKGHGYCELLCTLSECTFAAPFEINVFVQPFCSPCVDQVAWLCWCALADG